MKTNDKIPLDPRIVTLGGFWFLPVVAMRIYLILLSRSQNNGKGIVRATVDELSNAGRMRQSQALAGLDALREHGFIKDLAPDIYQLTDRWTDITSDDHAAIVKRRKYRLHELKREHAK